MAARMFFGKTMLGVKSILNLHSAKLAKRNKASRYRKS
jgi:hypothetical protein